MGAILRVVRDVPGVRDGALFDATQTCLDTTLKDPARLEALGRFAQRGRALAMRPSSTNAQPVPVGFTSLYASSLVSVRFVGSLAVVLVCEATMDLNLIGITCSLLLETLAMEQREVKALEEVMNQGVAHLGPVVPTLDWSDRFVGTGDTVGVPVMRHLLSTVTTFLGARGLPLLEAELTRRGLVPSRVTSRDFSDVVSAMAGEFRSSLVQRRFMDAVLGDDGDEETEDD